MTPRLVFPDIRNRQGATPQIRTYHEHTVGADDIEFDVPCYVVAEDAGVIKFTDAGGQVHKTGNLPAGTVISKAGQVHIIKVHGSNDETTVTKISACYV